MEEDYLTQRCMEHAINGLFEPLMHVMVISLENFSEKALYTVHIILL